MRKWGVWIVVLLGMIYTAFATGSSTESPSTSPTESPSTRGPTTSPSTSPSTNPSTSPTKNPSTSPSASPSISPTIYNKMCPVNASSLYGSGPQTWGQVGQDLNGDNDLDLSGDGVSLSFDGTRLAIGARLHDGENGVNSGHVKVYEFDSENQIWLQLGTDIDGEAADDQSGHSVSLSSDGSYVAVGADGNNGAGGNFPNAGHARVFKYDTGLSQPDWVQVGQDLDGLASNDFHGVSVSLSHDGKRVAVGAFRAENTSAISPDDEGRVIIYELNDTNIWNQLGNSLFGENPDDYFGKSVSLSPDGTTVAVGAYGYDGNTPFSDIGQVRIYKYSSGTWTLFGNPIDGDATYDNKGYAVSLSSDGTRVGIGVQYHDLSPKSNVGIAKVYEFDTATSDWQIMGDIIYGEEASDFKGTSVSLSFDGTEIAVGVPGYNSKTGALKIYRYNTSIENWEQIGTSIIGEADDDEFGHSVSLSGDGTRVAGGAFGNDADLSGSHERGHTRVFDLCESPVTVSPTKNPSGSPTGTPPESPTETPTGSPTGSPTGNPTLSPQYHYCNETLCGANCSVDYCAQNCTGVACGSYCTAQFCARECTGENCGQYCESFDCASYCDGLNCGQNCNFPDCAKYCTGENCGQYCEAFDCASYCDGLNCGQNCNGPGCAEYCTGENCGQYCTHTACAEHCTGKNCGQYCSQDECATFCSGENCGQNCTGYRCARLCSGNNCGRYCTESECAYGCNATNCGQHCTNFWCSYGCSGENCGQYCSDESCAQLCSGDECGQHCNGVQCAMLCNGDNCGQHCTDYRCALQCSGKNCGQNCIGEQCAIACNALNCGQNCTGLNCAFGCETENCGNNCLGNGLTADKTCAENCTGVNCGSGSKRIDLNCSEYELQWHCESDSLVENCTWNGQSCAPTGVSTGSPTSNPTSNPTGSPTNSYEFGCSQGFAKNSRGGCKNCSFFRDITNQNPDFTCNSNDNALWCRNDITPCEWIAKNDLCQNDEISTKSCRKSCLNETTCEEPTKRVILPDVDANFVACSSESIYNYSSEEEAKILCQNVPGVDPSKVMTFSHNSGLCEAPCPGQKDAFSCLNNVTNSLPDSVPGTGPMLSAYIVIRDKYEGLSCRESNITRNSNGTLTCSTENCFAEETGDCFDGMLEMRFGIFRHENDCFTQNLQTYDNQSLTLFRKQMLLLYYTGTMQGTCEGSDCIPSSTGISAQVHSTIQLTPNENIVALFDDSDTSIITEKDDIFIDWKYNLDQDTLQIVGNSEKLVFLYSEGSHNLYKVKDFQKNGDECTGGVAQTAKMQDLATTGTYYFYCSFTNHCSDQGGGMHLIVTVVDTFVPNTDKINYYNDPFNGWAETECEAGTYQDQIGQTECKQQIATAVPSGSPSTNPSGSPTTKPSGSPTTKPSGSPTTKPSGSPSTNPSGSPTTNPSGSPTTNLSGSPTTKPSGSPTTTPPGSPTTNPSGSPTTKPSGSPTTKPSRSPTTKPSGSPTTKPPSTQPTYLTIDWHETNFPEKQYKQLQQHEEIIFNIPDSGGTSFFERIGFNNVSETCSGGQEITDENGVVNKMYTSPGYYYYYAGDTEKCENGMQLFVTVVETLVQDTTDTGTYNDPYDGWKIKDCQIGTYQDETAQTECKPSNDCSAGTFVTNPLVSSTVASTQDRICQNCAVGKYSSTKNAQKCQICASGNHANDERTGCKEDSKDEDGLPDWAWIAIGTGAGVIFIVIVVYVSKMRMKKKGNYSTQENSSAGIGSLIY